MSDIARLLELLTDRKPSGFDPELSKLARFHGVIPLYRMQPAFADFVRRNQRRTLQLAAHLRQIEEQFTAEGISVLVLKGLPLGKHLFGDIAARKAGDIDLWIPEDTLDDVHDLLVAADHVGKTGYERLGDHDRRRYRRHRFHIGYIHEPTGISVEIHWRAAGVDLFPLEFNEALDRGREVDLGGFSVNTLGDLDNLVFLHLHAAKHLWERLFWLYDLKVFHESSDAPPIDTVIERAQELQLLRPVLAGLTLVQEFLQLQIPEPLPELDRATLRLIELGRQQLQKPFRPNVRHTVREAFEGAWLLRSDLGYRAKVIRDWLGGADDWHRTPLPRGLHWLYPLIRPYFWIQRRLRR